MSCMNFYSETMKFYNLMRDVPRPKPIENGKNITYRMFGQVYAEYVPAATTQDELWLKICQRHNLNPLKYTFVKNEELLNKPNFIVLSTSLKSLV